MSKEQNWNNKGEQFRETLRDALKTGDFKSLNDLVSGTASEVLAEAGKQAKAVTVNVQESTKAWKKEGKKLLPKKIKTKNVGQVSSILYMVFGGIGTGITGILLLMGIILTVTGWQWFSGLTFILLVGFAIFLLMIGKGRTENRRLKRMKRYVELCTGKMYVNIEYLAKACNRSKRYIQKDIRKMLELGFFPEGHMDEKESCLILSDEAYDEYLKVEERRKAFEQQESLRIKEEQKQERLRAEGEALRAKNLSFNQELQEMIKEGQGYIERIQRLNDLIQGESISEKLYCMERLLKEIFERLIERPKQMSKMHKLMNYYLPTTLKLVEAYEEFDGVSTPGENIISAKIEIEKTLDTINEAFSELLNKLFLDDTFDVTTDAQVLKAMLAKEGLTREM